ncbi:GGDEF domain-containing protein [Sinimarinibacterium sp. CAU 1509]|uniref:GGDEF domain-containing protein n=1 Tax=Sinimarinibacterium sp. CAU 1509 TaxID=2562283 RepID=UPI0010ABA662|nr:diguanylate cyclase [Sinimarinibacterium sp. CAU 1509]TJY65042.1 GGDEF domain-containing protein [Sinimarinibacterium sp. CAU 1509]
MTPASSESRLTSELQSLLARPIWSQRFSRRLELRFRRDAAERSTRLTRGTFTLALLILAVYLLIDGLTVQRLTDPVFAILVAGIGGSLTLIGAAGSYVPHWHHSLMRLLPFIMLVVNLAMVAAAGRCLTLGLPPPTELLVLQLINIQLLSGMSFRTTFPVALTTTAALILIEIMNGSGSISSIQDISFVIFALLTCSLGSFLSEQVMRRSWLQGRLLDHLANHDELTGLYNRHALIQRAEVLMQKAAHEHCAVSVILCDIDFFKRLNDRRGHLAGDEALRDVSEVLHQAAARRGTDIAARWGGEEFLLVLYDCDSDAAVARAEAARQHIERLLIPNPDAANGYLTMSFGCAAQEAGADLALNALVGAADTALYRAKSEGRNRTCVQGVAQQTTQTPSPDAINSAMQ